MVDALKQRNALKKKKPNFSRQDSHKQPKLGSKWRKPKGWHSKIRLQKKGYKRLVKIGWGSPSAAKGLSRTGKNIILIKKIDELTNINKIKDTVVISRTLGNRKRVEILNKAKEKSIEVMNFKKIDEKIKKINDALQTSKKKKLAKKQKKDSSKKDLEKKAKEKETETKEDTKTDEDKKKETLKKQQKILTKPGEE